MKPTLFVCLAILMLSITVYSASASTTVVDSTGIALTSSATNSDSQGAIIQAVNSYSTIVNISRYSGETASRVRVFNSSYSLVGSSTSLEIDEFYGLNILMVQGQNYYVEFDSSGGSQTRKYAAGVTFPIIGTDIKYVNGTVGGGPGSESTSAIFAIASVTTISSPSAFPGGFLHGFKFDSDGRDVNGTANLTNTGGVAFTNGSHANYGNASGPFAAGQALSVAHNLDLSGSTSFTISIWIKPYTLPVSVASIFFHETSIAPTKSNVIQLYNDSGVQKILANCGAGAGDISYPTTLSNEWHNLVLQKSASVCNLYLDGLQVDTHAAGAAGDGVDYVSIGAYDYLITSIIPFDGQIDSLYVWGSALSSGEILNISNGGGEFDFGFAPCTNCNVPVLSVASFTPVTPSDGDNLTAALTCYDTANITGHVQFYVNGSSFGVEQNASVVNNTNTTVGVVSALSTVPDANWTAEFWCTNDFGSTSKINITRMITHTLFSGSPNVTSPTSNQIVRGVSVNVTLGSREIYERINILVNNVNVVANNTNVSMLYFVVAVPVGNVNVTVRSDDVSGLGNVSSVVVPIRVSNLGVISNIIMSKPVFWVRDEQPVVNFSISSFDGYVVPTMELRLKNGTNGTVISEAFVSVPTATIGQFPNYATVSGIVHWGQTFIAEGDTIFALIAQGSNGAGYELRQGHGYLGTLIASGSTPGSFVGVHVTTGQEYTFLTRISGSAYDTGYVLSSLSNYSGGNLLADGNDYAGLDSSSFMIAFYLLNNSHVTFPLFIAQSYVNATFEMVINDTLFQETGESGSVALDAMDQPYVVGPNGTVHGIFDVAVSRARNGLVAPNYTVDSNLSGSWVSLPVLSVMNASVNHSNVIFNMGSYVQSSYSSTGMVFTLTQPVLINGFTMGSGFAPYSGTITIDGVDYRFTNNTAVVGRVFAAGAHTFDQTPSDHYIKCRPPFIVADPIFSWTNGGCTGPAAEIIGVHTINYTVLSDLVNITVDHRGSFEGQFNVRVRASDGYVTSNYSTSDQLTLVLNPEMLNAVCAALTYPNEEDLPNRAVIPLNFTISAGLGFTSSVVVAKLMLNGSEFVENCSYTQADNYTRYYNCTAPFHYYDVAGSYGFNITYVDGNKTVSETQLSVCDYALLVAARRLTSSVNFPGAAPGVSDSPGSNPVLMKNTGNAVLNLSLVAYSLVGRTNPSYVLNASLFKAGSSLGASVVMQDGVQKDLNMQMALVSNQSVFLWLSMPTNVNIQSYFSATPWSMVGTG